jgi:hypothetical protein
VALDIPYLSSDDLRIRLATTWMNEEWYNDRIQLEVDPDWVREALHHQAFKD